MKPILIAILATLITSCADYKTREQSPIVIDDSDYRQVAYMSLKYIEMRGSVETIAVPHGLAPNIRKALKSLRPIVDAGTMQRPADDVPPAGVFVLDTFYIDGGEALFKGTLGPAKTGTPCSQKFTIPWFISGNDWVNASYKVEGCGKRWELDSTTD